MNMKQAREAFTKRINDSLQSHQEMLREHHEAIPILNTQIENLIKLKNNPEEFEVMFEACIDITLRLDNTE